MRNAKWFTVSLVVFCCLLLGVGVFPLWPDGGLIEKAFGQRSPRVIFLGDPDERPEFKHELPPGYERRPEGLDALEFDVDTGDPNDPNALFEVGDYTDTGQQIWSAKELGKDTIYFFYEEKTDPNIETLPYEFSPKELIDILLTGGRALTFDAFGIFPLDAKAHTIGDPSTWNCTSSCSVPGQTFHYWQAPGPGGNCPGSSSDIYFVNKNMTAPYSWMGGVVVLKQRNTMLWNSGVHWTGKPTSLVDCMNTHNDGSNFMCYPTNLTHNMYRFATDLNTDDACHRTACGCGVSGVGGPQTTPRTSIDGFVWVAMKSSNGNCDLDSWSITRHELGHTYKYTDAEMSPSVNKDQMYHCRSSSGGHVVH